MSAYLRISPAPRRRARQRPQSGATVYVLRFSGAVWMHVNWQRFAAEGAEVTLFSAYGAELEMVRSSSGIGLRGAGPIGSYHVDREGTSIKTTAEIDGAVRGAEVIFLTGPVHKQRTYAMVLADHLNDGQILVLAPGRSLERLKRRGCCGWADAVQCHNRRTPRLAVLDAC